jgi:hypothetical protein
MRVGTAVLLAAVVLSLAFACMHYPKEAETNPAVKAQQMPSQSFETKTDNNAHDMLKEGRKIFRYETFGSEAFWGEKLRLHEAIAGNGAGSGLTPKEALALGLKVDMAAVLKTLIEVIKAGSMSLEKPETTLVLLRGNAVVEITWFFDKENRLRSIGMQCALCHSTVDDSFAKGIGRRLDGWPNRDLDVRAIAALAPDLKPLADHLRVDEATVKQVLLRWEKESTMPS